MPILSNCFQQASFIAFRKMISAKQILTRSLLLMPLLAGMLSSSAQKQLHITVAQPPLKSIRGLSAVSDDIVWASGTGGMVGRSLDGGNTWEWHQVKACDSCDWRSLYAFNDRKAVVINAGEPAHVFLTEDGGTSWQKVYFNATPGIFFDAVAFYNDREGMALGDPLQQHFAVLRTHDGGQTWQMDAPAVSPAAVAGESIFAASGTGLIARKGLTAFVTGGTVARLHTLSGDRWSSSPLPLLQGQPSAGAFSVAFLDNRTGIVVGGDYRNDTLRRQNCLLTSDGGRTWTIPHTAPGGFKSAVTWYNSRVLVTTGTSGTDISLNGGKDWQRIGEGFHCVVKARKGKRLFLAGKSIAYLEIF
ncbi:WD40/YVTN/BNR-like repeat-containing protein [Chitinophaga qingshengii]|uniref:Oxidoreductase n=1 Tax=Chitinophaga qingshengii TaxID=1569794 RepID=A0ABR7THY0_9BACT|nr:YCF48-related protein [Chitinophaga qingshengii]MBC9929595.1 oxidoreductase [Chitinophaga qingshengii]